RLSQMKNHLISTSKFLSLILRHRPETIGLKLDPNGWVEIATLIEAARQHGTPIELDLLLQVVYENDKQRCALSDDGLKIRANQGHSVEVDLELTATRPPAVLYHGTVARFLDSIREQGLLAGSRQFVHLSSDRHTAEIVGKRRGSPVILIVRAESMFEHHHEFFLSRNGVWLTQHVGPEYLEFPDR
ncbi:MAG TPA: RNA 2'-phosphotransferase, partial [Planctomycetaceae bacterium]|nr:RNA 2'-phosphotransferase [Planctomycetaceae bacterium]